MSKTMRILTGQGIGDSVWAVFKAQSIAKSFGCDRIEMLMACWNPNGVESRGLPVLNAFSFIDEAKMHVMPQTTYGPTLLPGWPTDEEGHYRYIPDGQHGFGEPFNGFPEYDFVAIPNRALERGIRLEDWLPEYETDWGAFDKWNKAVYKGDFHYPLDKYVVFFMSSAASNGIGSDCGHNNGPLWLPEQWAELGEYLISYYGVKIVVVGAEYDATYFRRFVKLHIKTPDMWVDEIGKYNVLETLAICSDARCLVGFQSGIPICSHYLGVPVACWWRPGDSSILGKSFDLRCDEHMSHCWTYPGSVQSGQYLPMIYTKTPVEVLKEWCERWI